MYDALLEQWQRYRKIARRARPYSSSPALVAKAMLRLNQHAHHRYSGKEQIYALKNGLLRYWYQRGYLVHVARIRQVLYCRACGGSGMDWYDNCGRCRGTGVWREYWLLEMTYRIDDRRYTFHQPEHLVDYLRGIVPVESSRVIEGTITSEREVSARFAEVCYCVIAQFLPAGFTSPYMRRRDLWRLWWHETRLYWRIYLLRDKWRKALRVVGKRWHAATRQPMLDYDEIPF